MESIMIFIYIYIYTVYNIYIYIYIVFIAAHQRQNRFGNEALLHPPRACSCVRDAAGSWLAIKWLSKWQRLKNMEHHQSVAGCEGPMTWMLANDPGTNQKAS